MLMKNRQSTERDILMRRLMLPVLLLGLSALTACDVLLGMQAAPDRPTTAPTPTSAADADVTYVRAIYEGDEQWTFYVTVEHPDTGWDDYADGWDVVLPDGTIADPDPSNDFTRLLLHPHENEQPFTRSQRGIVIPADVTQVTVRAHDLVDGYGGATVTVDLTQANGTNYEVQR